MATAIYDQRTETPRPGPVPLPDDSWDDPPRGLPISHRRPSNPRARWGTHGILLVTGLVAVSLAVLFGSGPAPASLGTAAPNSAGLPSRLNPTPAGGAPWAAASPGASTGASAAAGDHSPNPSGESGSTAGTAAEPPTTPGPAQPQFTGLVIEAEAGSPQVTLTGTATVTADPTASGGFLVTSVGTNSGAPAGTLVVSGLNVPVVGHYRILLYLANPNGGQPRSITMTVSGQPATTVTYAGGQGCCGTRMMEVDLPFGPVTITLSNDAGPAPAIDKISLVQIA